MSLALSLSIRPKRASPGQSHRGVFQYAQDYWHIPASLFQEQCMSPLSSLSIRPMRGHLG